MLAWILMIGAGVCLAYFIIIIIYAGIGTSYAGIWLLFVAALAGAAGCLFHLHKYPEKTGLRFPVSLVTVCAAGVVVMLIIQILIFGNIPAAATPDLDYVIVPGALVREDGISKTLQLRLDKAAEYAAQNPYTTLILSGGQGKNEPESEAEAMKEYLLRKGIPESQMMMEKQSRSTVENIAYSRLLIEKCRNEEFEKHRSEWEHRTDLKTSNAFAGMKMKKNLNNTDSALGRSMHVGILTSNFHLFRAEMIAKKQGEMQVYGIAAPSDPVLLIHLAVRDALAILKDRLMGNL